jgi:hypothetical protein
MKMEWKLLYLFVETKFKNTETFFLAETKTEMERRFFGGNNCFCFGLMQNFNLWLFRMANLVGKYVT